MCVCVCVCVCVLQSRLAALNTLIPDVYVNETERRECADERILKLRVCVCVCVCVCAVRTHIIPTFLQDSNGILIEHWIER